MKAAAQFERRVLEYLLKYRMIEHGMPLGVAVSGGADSVCLLHVLAKLVPKFESTLHVLHVNHGIRGAESDEDEAFVAAMAKDLGLPFRSRRVDPGSVPATGLEEWARSVRLGFFRQSMADLGIHRVATGHTMRDQAETVLFRLFRGAGSHGLGGIEPVSTSGFMRPMLWASRHDVITYLQEGSISWREDRSNSDLRFARNSLRNQWIPEIKAAWNPRLEEILAGTAEVLREESALLERIATETVAELFQETADGFEAEANRVAMEPVAIQRRLFRILATRLGSSGWDLEDVERARALTRNAVRSGSFRAGGVLIERSSDFVRVTGTPSRHLGKDLITLSDSAAGTIQIAQPGCLSIPGGGRLELVEISGSNPSVSNGLRGWNSGYTEGWSFIRPTVLHSGLLLRTWCAGDAYQPAGSRSPRKLKELFQRERIPRWQRQRILVLESEGRIVWCDRFGPSAQHVASPADESFLAVRYTENR